MLEEVKNALRVDGNDFDLEIQDLIDAALADLALSGIDVTDLTKPLIKRAVITYCRANFDYDDRYNDRLIASYIMLKTHLSLADDYKAVTL
jgi:uncharacterized phage protein (predicted DNA packaging)